MASTASVQTILKQLTKGDAEPVLVADFQAWTTAPRLSRLLSRRAEGHPVYQIDPVGVLSGDRPYLSLRDLAAVCVEEFLATDPASGRVFIVGHCSASALSLHVATLLRDSRDVNVILLGPAWPDEAHVRRRFAETLSNLRAAGRPCPELDGDPLCVVTRMENVLRAQIDALADSRGLDSAADAFAELLGWYRSWLAFLLACTNDPLQTWEIARTELIVLAGPAARPTVPGLSEGAYQVDVVPDLGDDDPITPELAEAVRARFTRPST
jgi:Alpha/beta hydrolase family